MVLASCSCSKHCRHKCRLLPAQMSRRLPGSPSQMACFHLDSHGQSCSSDPTSTVGITFVGFKYLVTKYWASIWPFMSVQYFIITFSRLSINNSLRWDYVVPLTWWIRKQNHLQGLGQQQGEDWMSPGAWCFHSTYSIFPCCIASFLLIQGHALCLSRLLYH